MDPRETAQLHAMQFRTLVRTWHAAGSHFARIVNSCPRQTPRAEHSLDVLRQPPTAKHGGMTRVPSIELIKDMASGAAFGRPLITNVHRGQIVEAIVACALQPEWSWCAADYSSWDFERADGTRLEVKQSAARQSWATSDKPSACSFDIAARKGRWEGATWVAEVGRAAHIYILAHHPVADSSADHRDPTQWRFHVVRTALLPDTQRLTLNGARSLAAAVSFAELKQAVEATRSQLA